MNPASKTNALTILLAVCGLVAAVTFVQQYNRSLKTDNMEIWYEHYGYVVERVSKSVVALEVELERAGSNVIEQNCGSGFIIDPAGYIVTNEHVIQQSKRIRVILLDKRQYIAVVVAADPFADLAVLKIEADGLTALPFGPVDMLTPGQIVISMGNPLGTAADGRAVATFGHINRLDQTLRSAQDHEKNRTYHNLIQTSAIILPGNSGGPLVNTMGQAVGIITAVAGMEHQFGFAITLDSGIIDKIEKLKQGQVIAYPCLGVNLAFAVDRNTQERLGLKELSGALVAYVTPQLPARKAGIRPGDLIRAVNNQRIHSPNELIERINQFQPNEVIRIELLRGAGGRSRQLTIPVELTVQKP